MKLLPVGSVVKLKDATKRLIIMGILQKNGDNGLFDYLGCPYPEGFIDADNMFLFNHADIEAVSFIGFDDVERQVFISGVEEEIKKMVDNSSEE